MNRSVSLASLSILGVLVAFAGEAAAAPGQIAFTARLANNGVPVNGSRTIEARLYDAHAGGSPLWMESYPAAEVTEGQVYLSLGSKSAGLIDQFNGQARFLEVVVDGQVMEPRLPMVSVPYAFRAAYADGADWSHWADDSGHALDADHADQADRAAVADQAVSLSVSSNITVANLTVTGSLSAGSLNAWPSGSYCIFRNGACPAGFNNEEIAMDIGNHQHDVCPGDEVAGSSTYSGEGFCYVRIRMCCK